MSWFLYLIECQDGSIYTGITVDVAARYAAHAAGKGARYTRSHPPQRLLATLEYADRSSASKAEYQVKQMKPIDKRAFGLQHVAASMTEAVVPTSSEARSLNSSPLGAKQSSKLK